MEDKIKEVQEEPKKKKGGIPKCPEGSAQFGDKDPVVIAWHKKYRSDLYKVKYEEYVKKNKIKL